MKTKTSKSFWLLLIIFIFALAAFWLLEQTVASGTESFHLLVRPVFFVWALGVYLVQEGLNPVFAKLALHSIGSSTRYWPQLWITLFSTSANSTVPVPAGIPIRVFLQKKIVGVSYTKSSSGVLIETLVGYGATGVAAVVAAYIWLRPVWQEFRKQMDVYHHYLSWVLIAVFFVVVFVSFFIWQKRLFFVKWLKEAGGVLVRARVLPLIGMLLIMLFSFGLALLRFLFLLWALDVQAGPGEVMAALLVSRIAGVLSFVPMGLGVRDASLSSFLVLAGVPLPQAIAAASLDRIVITLPYLVGGVVASRMLGRSILDGVGVIDD